MNMVSVNFHFSFGILAVVQKTLFEPRREKRLQFLYKPGCTAIDHKD